VLDNFSILENGKDQVEFQNNTAYLGTKLINDRFFGN